MESSPTRTPSCWIALRRYSNVIFTHSNEDAKFFLVLKQVLHDLFGDEEYWSSRRSMRFSKELQGIANQFRREQLQSDDEKEGTVMSDNWKEHVVSVASKSCSKASYCLQVLVCRGCARVPWTGEIFILD